MNKLHTVFMTAGIIGATGYAGAELFRLLSGHSKIKELMISSVSFEGSRLEDVYPNFIDLPQKLKKTDGILLKADEVIASSDLVFSALPHAAGEPFAAACMERKIHYIDLSADFRFGENEETYSAWYGKPYQYPELHKNSIYGLPELNRQKIKELADKDEPVIIGNPGCYPTGASLGVFPVLVNGLFNENGTVIINSISGTSGGGREPSRQFHYSECADSISPYKIVSHRHSPEIEQNFTQMAAINNHPPPKLIFTPHLAPMNRGILSSIYIPLSKDLSEITAKEIHNLYFDFYKDEPFVRVLPEGLIAATNRVRRSNYCDISIHFDVKTLTLIVITAIDNMVKGAAGQAVQNMNILFGFDETAGLEEIPALF